MSTATEYLANLPVMQMNNKTWADFLVWTYEVQLNDEPVRKVLAELMQRKCLYIKLASGDSVPFNFNWLAEIVTKKISLKDGYPLTGFVTTTEEEVHEAAPTASS